MPKILHDLPIAAKVALAPLFAIACLVAVSAVARLSNQASSEALRSLSKEQLPRIEVVAKLKTRVAQLDGMVMRSLAYEGSGMKAARVEAVDKAIVDELKAMQAHVEQLRQAAPPQDHGLYEGLQKSLAGFAKLALDTLDMKSSGLSQAAMLMTSAEQAHVRLSESVDKLVATVNGRIQAEVAQANATAARADTVTLATLLGALLVSGTITWLCRSPAATSPTPPGRPAGMKPGRSRPRCRTLPSACVA